MRTKKLHAYDIRGFHPDIDQLETLGTQIQWADIKNAEAGTVLLAPETAGPPVHYHPAQQEEFFVHSGELMLYMDGQWKALKAGESATIPKNTSHTYKNTSKQTVMFDFCLSPKVRFREMMEMMDDFVQQGKIKGTDFTSVLYLCRTMADFPDVTRSVKPPQFIVNMLAAVTKIIFK